MSKKNRFCQHCGEKLKQKDYEKAVNFAMRKYCSYDCAGTAGSLLKRKGKSLDDQKYQAAFNPYIVYTGFKFPRSSEGINGCPYNREVA